MIFCPYEAAWSRKTLYRDRAMLFLEATEFPKRQRRVAARRRPIVSTLIIALLAGGTAFTTAFLVPKIWPAIRRSQLTYEQCKAVKEDMSRLARYHGAIGRKSLDPGGHGG